MFVSVHSSCFFYIFVQFSPCFSTHSFALTLLFSPFFQHFFLFLVFSPVFAALAARAGLIVSFSERLLSLSLYFTLRLEDAIRSKHNNQSSPAPALGPGSMLRNTEELKDTHY